MSEQWGIAPYFVVDDVVSAANFYRDKLGFHYERFWGEPPAFCMVKRAGITIMLAQVDAVAHKPSGRVHPNRLVDPDGGAWDSYIWIDDADALYAEFKSRGVKIAREICNQMYECRDFEVDDSSGYRLCFGMPL